MALILVGGKAGSGKTTVVNMFIQEFETLNIEVKTFALADKLKEMVYMLCTLYNMPINSVQDLNTVGVKEKYRHHMQYIGTEICQSIFGKTCWCELIGKQIAEHLNKTHGVAIISDLRFEHEFEYFLSESFRKLLKSTIATTIIKVNRPHLNINDKEKYQHSSEQQIDNIPTSITVDNSGTLEDLKQSVHTACREILETSPIDVVKYMQCNCEKEI